MNARSVVFEMSPDKVDDAVRQFEDRVIPRFREISGYKGFTLLVNRENGKTDRKMNVGVAAASRERASGLRLRFRPRAARRA